MTPSERGVDVVESTRKKSNVSGRRGAKSSASSHRPVGRPTDYKPEYVQVVAELAKAGATDVEMARALRIATSTLYLWRSRFPEFSEAVCIPKQIADTRVEMALYRLAVGQMAYRRISALP